MKTIIFINGAPRSGKDTLGNIIKEVLGLPKVHKFAEVLKNKVHEKYGLQVPHDYFESVKDVPCLEFGLRTPREAYIEFSEKYAKLTFGKEIFGEWLRDELIESPRDLAVVTDSGFSYELNPIVKHFTPHNCYLIRVHRKGFDFSKDSRSLVFRDDVLSCDFFNDGGLGDVVRFASRYLERLNLL